MKFRFCFADQIVGLFVLTSVALICLALILIGINKRWLRDDLVYISNFISAKGLRVGMSVTLKGFKIGELKTFDLNNENLVDVTLVIYEEYLNKVVKNSVIEVQVSPIGLGSEILFYPGIEKDELLLEGSLIYSTHFPDGRRLVKDGKVDKGNSGDPIAVVLKDADQMILSLNSLLIDLDETIMGYNPGPVGEILIGIEKIMPSINRTLDDVNLSILPGISSMIDDVNNNKLPEVDNILSDFNEISSSFVLLSKDLETIEGIIPKILDPEGSEAAKKIYNQIFNILDELHNSMIKIRELTEYLNGLTPEITSLVEGTGATIEEAEKVLQGLKNNPLLRGGIEEEQKQNTVSSGIRDGEF